MTQHTLLRFVTLFIFTLAFTAAAYAQPQRTFVSAHTGNDANTVNNCSLMQPCRNFNAAVGVVNAGGEVVALDSGGYGTVTIDKAVTLTSPSGVYAAITALTAGSSAITVSAPGEIVVLRGLTLTGLGGDFGINVTAVGILHVEGCVISGFAQSGIRVFLAVNGVSGINIKDTMTRNNNGYGIFIATSTGEVRASIDNCRSEYNNVGGFTFSDNSRGTINRSVASNNGIGFHVVNANAGATAELNCEECVASNNLNGFASFIGQGAATKIRVSRSMATNNLTTGFTAGASTLFESLGNNLVRGNNLNTQGTITIVTAN